MTTWSQLKSNQPIAIKMLQNSIEKQRTAHAYLFHGPKGTGKVEASLLFAMSYFCENREGTSEPCGECHSCKRIQTGNHPDVHWIKPDGQSIKKEQIEHLQKEFTYTGLESTQKCYIIEDAEKMTVHSANRLLKFLEEPSRQTVAILLSENIDSMLATILSRCQRIQFQPLSQTEQQQYLIEQGIPDSTARICVAMNLNIYEAKEWKDDEWFAEARKIVLQLMEKVMNSNNEGYLFIHQAWFDHFKDRNQLETGLELLLLWFKDIILYHLDEKEQLVFYDQSDRIERYHQMMTIDQAKHAVYNILDTKRRVSMNVHQTLAMEHLVLQI
ncbi:DNA polymerase III subunit delta' [Halalkalibacillus sediminis]|uniref:DNA polymerase III subunit delta' n=1 Tax=Halalkalibacillus sediminis TaxID=2018042 RepID=A0A2I0QT11_9BACI|nr:DNA polymerase III subunit delta' [Halalkalibacillus sediminis]PKR77481.1 DNA polymerase III subunit delta' [Halalkalibacillus sediminis]